jgi:hypothetical protein
VYLVESIYSWIVRLKRLKRVRNRGLISPSLCKGWTPLPYFAETNMDGFFKGISR